MTGDAGGARSNGENHTINPGTKLVNRPPPVNTIMSGEGDDDDDEEDDDDDDLEDDVELEESDLLDGLDDDNSGPGARGGAGAGAGAGTGVRTGAGAGAGIGAGAGYGHNTAAYGEETPIKRPPRPTQESKHGGNSPLFLPSSLRDTDNPDLTLTTNP